MAIDFNAIVRKIALKVRVQMSRGSIALVSPITLGTSPSASQVEMGLVLT